MTYLLLLHAAGAAGGIFARKFRVPAGYLLGSMFFAMLLIIFADRQYAYPQDLRAVIQVFSGIVIGLNFTRSDLILLRHMLKPALLLVLVLLGFNVILAAIISQFTPLTHITALFAAAPGGISDLALIAVDFGADTQQVAILQVFRFAFVVSFFPFAVRRILARTPLEQTLASAPHNAVPAKVRPLGWNKAYMVMLTLLAAGAGALLFRWLEIPAGTLVGSLTAVAILNAAAQKVYFPIQARAVVQVFAGSYIGSLISLQSLLSLQALILPMAFVIAQVMAMTFGAAWVLRRFTTMDYATSLFSSVPGGITEMGIIAGEMGLNVPQIVMLHTCRIIAVIGMIPLLLHLLTR